MSSTARGTIVAISVALAAACASSTGPGGAGGSSGGRSSACSSIEPGRSPIRRLTRVEYDATIRDLLGDDSHPSAAFPSDERVRGFENQADALGVTQLLAEQYQKAAEAIAGRAVKNLAALLPCDPSKGEDACASSFVATFGERAFRRPLDDATRQRFVALYRGARAQYDVPTSFELVVEAMLESPRFLYRVELGSPGDPGAVVPLDDWEMASRLSYFLWESMPDDALFAAARAGSLHEADGVRAQAERMLGDPRARLAIARFHDAWLGLLDLASVTKDPKVFPLWSDRVPSLLAQETELTLARAVLDDRADVATLFTLPYSMMNGDLAAFYGVKGPSGEAFERVDLDPRERSGFLTHASLLATYAKPNRTSPVHRGKLVRERLLCQPPPPPPPGVPPPPEVDPHTTYRKQLEEHRTNPACSGCHDLLDPIGLGFEHYDGIGAWRDRENGFPVDATGAIEGATDARGDFDGAPALAKKLAASADVRACVATQWFRFAYGRDVEDADECTRAEIDRAFADAGFRVRDLLIALTQTDAFRYRRAYAP